MSLVLQSSGGGSVTLQEPVTASNLTITVPAVTGTMLTTASAGTVLQVVNYTTTATVATSSATYVTTGFSNSITPTSSTSKILVLLSCCLYSDATSGETQTQIYRNGSNVSGIVGDIFNSGGRLVGAGTCFYLDSPATTSSTTYTLFFRQTTAGAGYVGVNNTATSIILMEIAG
jgi:hypothetical protein